MHTKYEPCLMQWFMFRLLPSLASSEYKKLSASPATPQRPGSRTLLTGLVS